MPIKLVDLWDKPFDYIIRNNITLKHIGAVIEFNNKILVNNRVFLTRNVGPSFMYDGTNYLEPPSFSPKSYRTSDLISNGKRRLAVFLKINKRKRFIIQIEP